MSDESRNRPKLPARPSLDPELEAMRRLGYRAIDRIVEHTAGLSSRPVVGPRPSPEILSERVDETVPEHGSDPEACLDYFFDELLPDVTFVNHPRFHAFIPGGQAYVAAIGAMMAAGTNIFAGSWLGAGSVAALEVSVLRWVASAIGCTEQSAGIFTSGGSMANLTCLAAARAHCGLESTSEGVVYRSGQAHNAIDRALRVLGYAPETICEIEVDENFALRVDHLESMVARDLAAGRRPAIVCATAGSTDVGAVDPMAALADFCQREGLWLHVDAAYGGFAAMTGRGRALLAGMERADSLALDPHKWLYAPLGTGCAFVRNEWALESAFASEGHYLADLPRDEINFFERGPELSRPARVLSVWMLMRSCGLQAIRAQIDADLDLARLAATLISENDEFELVCAPVLSVVAFRTRARPGESEAQRGQRDMQLVHDVMVDGETMISSTKLAGKTALRLVVLNHRTDEVELRRSLSRIFELVVRPCSAPTPTGDADDAAG